jgi:hypothetical protein
MQPGKPTVNPVRQQSALVRGIAVRMVRIALAIAANSGNLRRVW